MTENLKLTITMPDRTTREVPAYIQMEDSRGMPMNMLKPKESIGMAFIQDDKGNWYGCID